MSILHELSDTLIVAQVQVDELYDDLNCDLEVRDETYQEVAELESILHDALDKLNRIKNNK